MAFQVENADHVTVAVTDVDAAIAFFALLGFKEDHVARIDGGVPAAYMGMPTMKADHITLVLDREPRFEIQLLRFDDEQGSPADPPSNLRRRGFNHLALRVDDLDAASAHLRANGVRPLNEPMTFISRRLEFFEGPEEVTVELVEWVDPPG
jgi:catechol 2,3-dioxygenase-like lactoylglutathione lyase family enzyme